MCRQGENIAPHCCPFCLPHCVVKEKNKKPNADTHIRAFMTACSQKQIADFFFSHQTKSFQLNLPIWLHNNHAWFIIHQQQTKVPHIWSSCHIFRSIITNGWLDIKGQCVYSSARLLETWLLNLTYASFKEVCNLLICSFCGSKEDCKYLLPLNQTAYFIIGDNDILNIMSPGWMDCGHSVNETSISVTL